jgi:exportin-1
MEAAAAHLLNFAQPFDCSLLDQIVLIAADGAHPQRPAANEFLVKMKDHPDMWRRADAILESSKQLHTKFFGLQVLNEAIATHWKVIPVDQREGIRSYVVGKILALSTSDDVMKANSTFLSRLNLVLVAILKQDWPHNWPTFISDIVGSSKTSESLCENNMKVLQLLSEEVFDYSRDSMTTAKIKLMKESLNEEFAQIFQVAVRVHPRRLFIYIPWTKSGLLTLFTYTLTGLFANNVFSFYDLSSSCASSSWRPPRSPPWCSARCSLYRYIELYNSISI